MSNMDVLDLFEDLNKDRKLRDIPFLLFTLLKKNAIKLWKPLQQVSKNI